MADGRRAFDICRSLLPEFHGGFHFCIRFWSFANISDARFLRRAVRDAARADVIIVAPGPLKRLPRTVSHWVWQWAIRKRGQTAALMALLERSRDFADHLTSIDRFLMGVAGVAGLDFLSRHQFRGQEDRLFYPGAQAAEWPESAPPASGPALRRRQFGQN